jgi:hypothetical protein
MRSWGAFGTGIMIGGVIVGEADGGGGSFSVRYV